MEKRSRRRTRDLVTQAASQGLSENEIGCARISMMAGRTNAPCKGRIQMRKTNPLHLLTFGLQRTAGPYSWVKLSPPTATELSPFPPHSGLAVTTPAWPFRASRSEADSHPADPPAMAVPETLRHPFAAAKIVTPGTWIVARRRDACSNAALRACRRRGERTSDRCDRDEGSKCLLHSRALLQMTPSVSARSKPNTRSSSKKGKIELRIE